MGAVKSFTCWGCGGPHKKGDPECKAGKFDVHQSAPAVYKDRMNKKRKAEKVKAEKDGGNKSPKKKGKANEKEKKPCRAFNFGKGNCRYGDKCKFSHEKKKEDYKAGEFSPQQEKIVSAMVASAVKKTAALISKKNKKKGKNSYKHDKRSDNLLNTYHFRQSLSGSHNILNNPRLPSSFSSKPACKICYIGQKNRWW